MRAARPSPWGRAAALALAAALSAACTPGAPTPPHLPDGPLTLVLDTALKAVPGTGAASSEATWLADRVVAAGDHGGRQFVVIDKRAARLHVFDAHATLRASTPVLLGAAAGDDSVPGIGNRPLHQVLPGERTTPAGRFIGEPGHNLSGEDIIWVDYDAAVSIHRVRATRADEQRLQRLHTPAIDDNRISYGCINVPARFYNRHLHSLFSGGKAMVYILPDTRSAVEVFGSGLDTTRPDRTQQRL